MNIIMLTIVVLYIFLMLAIGLWAKKRTTSTKDFLVAGQSLGFFVMAIATFASVQSGWGMFGNTGTIYGWGIQGAITAAIIAPLGFTLAWFLLGRKLRTMANYHTIYSVPDVIRVRYGSKVAHVTVSIAIFIGSVGYMTTQIAATGLITSLLFDIPFNTGAWIGAVIVATYTILGGMIAAVWTDMIQGVMMVVMSIIIFIIAMNNVGGWSNMLNSIYLDDPQAVTLVTAMPLTWIFSNTILILFGTVGQPQIITKFLMIKNEKELKWGALVTGIAYSITTFFVIGIGLSMKAMVATGKFEAFDDIDLAITSFLGSEEVISPIIAGLALVTLLAAIMSSASSFITIGASAIMRDLAQAFNIKVKKELLWGRIFSGIVVLLSVLVALYLDQIIYLMGAFGWSAFAAATFGPIAIGIYWRRATGLAAFLSMIIALLFNVVFTVLGTKELIVLPESFFAGGITFVLGILIFIIASYFTKSSEDKHRFDSLYTKNTNGGEQQ